MDLGRCFEGSTNITSDGLDVGGAVKKRGQEWFQIIDLANWMNGWWTPGTTAFWILIRVQKEIIYSTSSCWTAVIFQAQCWTLGVLRWFRFHSCPLRYSQWSMRDRYVQQMCICYTSTSRTQFEGGMTAIAPTSGRNPGVISNFSLTKFVCILWQFAIPSLLLLFYSDRSGISLFSGHINGMPFPM